MRADDDSGLDVVPAPPPDHRRRGRRRGGVRLVAVLLAFCLLLAGGVVGAAFLLPDLRGRFTSAADYGGEGTGSVQITVAPGESLSQVGSALADAGVVASQQAFYEAAVGEPQATSLQPGTYELRRRMSAAAALALLLDPSSRVQSKVVIPEGSTAAQVVDRVVESTKISRADLEAALANPTALGLPAYAKGNPEGFLFPATYSVEPSDTAVTVLRAMVTRFQQAADAVNLTSGAQALGRSPYDVVIVASMIERETRVPEEDPKVAAVIYNRLAAGTPLGIDATVLYGLGRTSGGLTESDLAKDTPYNSRLRTGLPPTPISNPGKTALEAALHPAAGDWLYYVLEDAQGHHLFTSNYNEFLNQKNKSKAEGIL